VCVAARVAVCVVARVAVCVAETGGGGRYPGCTCTWYVSLVHTRQSSVSFIHTRLVCAYIYIHAFSNCMSLFNTRACLGFYVSFLHTHLGLYVSFIHTRLVWMLQVFLWIVVRENVTGGEGGCPCT